jgi:hypothetical protein
MVWPKLAATSFGQPLTTLAAGLARCAVRAREGLTGRGGEAGCRQTAGDLAAPGISVFSWARRHRWQRAGGAGMAGREKILDPTGFDERAADTTLAPRPASLRGQTVGLLENAKPNAALLLSSVGRELQRQHGVQAAVLYTKSYFGTPTEESLILRILHNCDFVVAGIGD